jgi:hypothetical protein
MEPNDANKHLVGKERFDLYPTPNKEPYLTLKEAAAVLRCTVSTMYQRRNGPPRSKPIGSNRWLYSKDKLIKWVESFEQSKGVKDPGTRSTVDSTKRREYHRKGLYRDET